MYIWVDDKIVFPHSGSSSTQQWILLSSSGAKYTHWTLSGEEFDWGSWKKQDDPTLRFVGRPSAAATNVVSQKSPHNQHWQAKSPTKLFLYLCSVPSHKKSIVYKCARYDVGQCVWCFVLQNTTGEQICKAPSLLILCVMIKQWSKVPQTWSKQNYVSNELFTPCFI